MYKPLADNTLMSMTKKEIIEHLRIAEYNHKVAEETIDQQYRNCQKLLKEEYNEALKDFVENISLPMTEEQIGEIVEKLKR